MIELPRPLEPAPLDLSARLGDFVLVGSWARDLCLLEAGRELGRATDDLDIAVATPTLDDLDRRLGDLAPRGGHGVRVRCHDIDVDVLPFGGVARDGIVEPDEDSSLDVTGIAEAFDHARRHVLPAGLEIRAASLPTMIALKVVAWDVRSPGTDKDAEDLARLMDATYGPNHLDHCYTSPHAERWDYDVELIGPFEAGRELARTLRPSSRARVTEILTGPRRDRLAALMNGIRRYEPQLDALTHGLTTTQEQDGDPSGARERSAGAFGMPEP